jgi:hypothetical protein
MELTGYDLRLLFEDDAVTALFPASRWERGMSCMELVRAYLAFRTFVSYSLLDRGPDPTLAWETAEEVHTVTFRLARVPVGAVPAEPLAHCLLAEAQLSLHRVELLSYLRSIDHTLVQALGYYLRACDNPRSLLYEYHKAYEVIKDTLGGKKALRTALAISRNRQEKFTRLCNPNRKGLVSSMARHAPEPGGVLDIVDPRVMWRDRTVYAPLETATLFCREVIDRYLTLLVCRTAIVDYLGLQIERMC